MRVPHEIYNAMKDHGRVKANKESNRESGARKCNQNRDRPSRKMPKVRVNANAMKIQQNKRKETTLKGDRHLLNGWIAGKVR